MMKYSYILFDLDGTLTKSGEGIVNSILYALKKNGIKETDREKLNACVGPPLDETFKKYYGVPDELIGKYIDDYREYFHARGWAENAVYPGIPESMQTLCSQGRRLAVATSKPEEISKQIISYFHLDPYLTLVAGATMDGSRSKKGDVIAYALKRLEAGRPQENVLMVGDRAEDVIGAKENGIPCIGVLYGYGSEEELTLSGADAICAETTDLPEVIAALERESRD